MAHLFQSIMNYLKYLKATYVDTLSYKNHTILFSILASLILFDWLKPYLLNYRWSETNHLLASLILVFTAILAFPIKRKDLPAIMRPLIYISSAMATFYIVTARDPFLYKEIPPQIALELQLIVPIACFCFIIGFWRPIFACFPFLLMNWKKADLSEVLGYKMFKTDFEIISEMGLLFICALVLLGFFRHLRHKKTLFKFDIEAINHHLTRQEGTKLHFLEYTTFIALAAHLSNYFYSGWQKIVLSPSGMNPFFWITENYTQYLLLTNHELTMFPLSFSEELSKITYQLLDSSYIILNILVLVGQLASVLVLRNVRATLFITLFFDIMHVVIFLTTGIFFWKWILLNTSIVIGLTAFGSREISNDFKTFLCLFVLCAPMLFWITKLGWYETRAFNHFYIEAITKDNKVVKLPPSYFWSASGTIGQNALLGKMSHRRPFYFDTMTMSTTNKYFKMYPANRCERWHDQDYSKTKHYYVENYDPTQYYEDKVISNEPVYKNLVAFFQRHHNFIKEKQPSKLEFYLYPHHFYAWWWYYPEFQKLDLNDIIGYRINTEAVCLGFENGNFTREIKAKESHDIFVE